MAKKTKPERIPSSSVGKVDLVEVERLLEFMQKHRLEQFEYERDGVHVMLKRSPDHPRSELRSAPVYEPAAAPAAQAAPAASGVPTPGNAPASPEPADDLHVIKSPIVGTFYSAPTPGAEPFVTVGSRVESGQALCIIEAMKLMNEIEADIAGEVAKIFVENGHPVEYGEALFGIRPSRKK
jgi:acetyl-CoA carboxylase biotin carboxyl carrier protein